MVTAAIWPALDYSRVPYRLYHDTELYRREQESIFQGPVWNYLGLDTEIPNPGVSTTGPLAPCTSHNRTITARSRSAIFTASTLTPARSRPSTRPVEPPGTTVNGRLNASASSITTPRSPP